MVSNILLVLNFVALAMAQSGPARAGSFTRGTANIALHRREYENTMSKRDEPIRPAGNSTKDIPRPLVGEVPYGVRVGSCTQPGQIALTFDDGPSDYTNDLLDLLDKYNAKATFFVTGGNNGWGLDNCSSIFPGLLKRMHDSGHQIGLHTWNHPSLNSLTGDDFDNQIYWDEMAIRNILGFIPTYMRPPYFDCNSNCATRMKELGYHIIYADIDTRDWANGTPDTIQNSKNIFTTALERHPENALVLAHDVHMQTVYNLTETMLQSIAANGYEPSVTVGTCLNDPPENWYRKTGTPVICSDAVASSKPVPFTNSTTPPALRSR